MYLGSRPALSVARWSTRPDLSVPGFGLPDYNAVWPIHPGQSNKIKHHPYASISSPLLRGAEDIRRFENASPFLMTSTNHSLTEYQSWPKSEFELVEDDEDGDDDEGEEEGISGMVKTLCGIESDSLSFNVASEWSASEETVLGRSGSGGGTSMSALTKAGSVEECQTVVLRRATSADNGVSLQGDSDTRVSLTRQGPMEGRDFLERELVFNRHVHQMKLALPVRSTQSGRPNKRQTRTTPVCRSSACRRRVHPVGKFTDEFVNWMPHSGATDDEKDEDDDNGDSENFKHCIHKAKKPTACNENSDVRVDVKHNSHSSTVNKRSCHLSRHRRHHHPKRKRSSHFAADRKDGGLHTRRRKQHNPWSIEETRMLIKGVSICGEGHWADIKRLEFKELASRSPVDLKDKWRNLLRLAQMTQTQSRNKKVSRSIPPARFRRRQSVVTLQGEKRTDLPADMLQQVRTLGTYQK